MAKSDFHSFQKHLEECHKGEIMNSKLNLKQIWSKITKPDFKAIDITEPVNYFAEFDITAERIINAINEFRNSKKLKDLAALYDDLLEADDGLSGNIDIRMESLKTRALIIKTELTDKQADYFDVITEDFYTELVEIFLWAKLKRFEFRQIEYEQVGALWFPKQFHDYKGLDLRIEDNQLELYTDGEKKTLDDYRFIRLLRKNSIIQPLMKYYVFFAFALNNWATLTEMYGKPWRTAKYEPGITTQANIDSVFAMLKKMGTNMAGVFPKSVEVEFKDFQGKSASKDLYESLIKFCDSRSTKRVLGTTVVTEQQAIGSNAKAKTAREVTKDILRGDAREFSTFISGFYTRLNQINFNQDQIIKAHSDISEPIDLHKEIDLDVKLQNQIGIYLDDDYFYDTYNRPRPKDQPTRKADEKAENKIKTLMVNLPKPINFDDPDFDVLNVMLPGNSINARKINNFRRQALKYRNKSMKKIFKEVGLIHDQLAEMSSFDDLENLELSGLQSIFGRELRKFVEYSSKKGFLNGRKPKGSQNTNHKFIVAGADDLSLEDEIVKMLEIDWTLDAEDALDNYRMEAMQVSGVESGRILTMIQTEAQNALSEGITFSQFRENLELNGYEAANPYHLRTNFNTAINGGYAGGHWLNIEDNKDLFPYLQYLSVLLDSTREEHAAAHGTILPVDDPWWDEHYPPNDWNCLCDAMSMTAEEAEEDPNFGKPKPEMEPSKDFTFNPGKDKTLWGEWLKDKV
jgi:SPP1 gp7 family putative phage head morphogenesis protein